MSYIGIFYGRTIRKYYPILMPFPRFSRKKNYKSLMPPFYKYWMLSK